MKKCFPVDLSSIFSDGVLVAVGRPAHGYLQSAQGGVQHQVCRAVAFTLDGVGRPHAIFWQRDYVGLLNLITRFVEFDRVIKFERQQFVQSSMSGLKFS